MSFMKKYLGPIASGLGYALAPVTGGLSIPIGQIAGGALGAWGASGKQGGTTGSQSSNFNNTYGGFNQATQDPLTNLFRENMYGQYGQAFRDANKPIYGDAQKAGYLNDLNDLAKSSVESLRGSLARSGRLDSGAADQGLSDIERARYGQYSSFLGQLPFMESQAKFQRMLPLLQGAGAFAATAPTSTRFGGTQAGTNAMTSEQTMQGPSFWKQAAGDLGGLAGDYFGKFKGRNPYTPPLYNPTFPLEPPDITPYLPPVSQLPGPPIW